MRTKRPQKKSPPPRSRSLPPKQKPPLTARAVRVLALLTDVPVKQRELAQSMPDGEPVIQELYALALRDLALRTQRGWRRSIFEESP